MMVLGNIEVTDILIKRVGRCRGRRVKQVFHRAKIFEVFFI